jgi:flagellar basal-body rod modification protein FlgD
MTVTSATAAPAAAGTTTSSASTQLSAAEQSDRFLTLLVTQMKNQDPLNPMDNAQITTQMAQISTVSGIDKLSSAVTGLNNLMLQTQTLEGAALVGKDVLVAGNKITLDTDGATTIGFDLDTVAKNVVVSVKDSSGKIVDTLNLGTTKAGQQTFNWQSADKTATGLTFEVSATDASGKAVGATKLVLDKVNSISSSGGQLNINLQNNGDVKYADVRAVG